MTTLIKIHRKGQMTLPSRLRTAIGVTEGDVVEATLFRGKIVITPKIVIDRSQFPNADGEYTPAQRRIIDAELAEAVTGPFHGPFETHEAMTEFLHKEVKKKANRKQTTKRQAR